jgi:hypothetical protein
LHPATDTQLLPTIVKAARPLLGSPPVYTSSSQQFFDHFSLPPTSSPFLIALKDHEEATPTDILSVSAQNETALTKWMIDRRLPSALELSDSSFQEVMKAPNNPLVVLVAIPGVANFAEREFLIGETRSIAMRWRELALQRGTSQQAVFVWMDAERWAKWLKSMYGIKGSGEVVIADHAVSYYHFISKHDGIRTNGFVRTLFTMTKRVRVNG